MNLRIGDAAELVAFLHEVVSASGSKVLSTGGYDVVDVNGRFFYHAARPLTVGGPFPSLAALVRSEGMRRCYEPGECPEVPASVEIFEWAGSFFTIAKNDGGHVAAYPTLEEARRGMRG